MSDAIQNVKDTRAEVRDAATVILVRDRTTNPHILMGQRGAKAVFMPSKFVFPGGAVDPLDAQIPLAAPLPEVCAARLLQDTSTVSPGALAVAAIREVWEETGLVIGRSGVWPETVPADWLSFSATGHLPAADGLQFVFRAITPPGRPRRFDARFFLVDASQVAGSLDDFSAATDELSHLQWVPLDDARHFDMPFITEVVLAEVSARLHDLAPPQSVPFFQNNDEDSLFRRLKGNAS